jgi:hypothetical protein
MIAPTGPDPMMELPERVSLARRPTPIQPLARTSADLPVQLWAWRDDLTGCVLSGNKIRKLEFLLAEAQQQGATAIVTCGGLQSNHVRATVFAARRLGLEVTTVLRLPPEGSEPKAQLTANFLLDRQVCRRPREGLDGCGPPGQGNALWEFLHRIGSDRVLSARSYPWIRQRRSSPALVHPTLAAFSCPIACDRRDSHCYWPATCAPPELGSQELATQEQ